MQEERKRERERDMLNVATERRRGRKDGGGCRQRRAGKTHRVAARSLCNTNIWPKYAEIWQLKINK